MGVDFVPTGIATGVAGSIFGKEVTTVIAAAGTFVPAAGLYYYFNPGANVQFQIQDSTGAWNSAAQLSDAQMICSDGVNVRFLNNGVGNQNVTLIKVG